MVGEDFRDFKKFEPRCCNIRAHQELVHQLLRWANPTKTTPMLTSLNIGVKGFKAAFFSKVKLMEKITLSQAIALLRFLFNNGSEDDKKVIASLSGDLLSRWKKYLYSHEMK